MSAPRMASSPNILETYVTSFQWPKVMTRQRKSFVLATASAGFFHQATRLAMISSSFVES